MEFHGLRPSAPHLGPLASAESPADGQPVPRLARREWLNLVVWKVGVLEHRSQVRVEIRYSL